jgi:hypothetical protein
MTKIAIINVMLGKECRSNKPPKNLPRKAHLSLDSAYPAGADMEITRHTTLIEKMNVLSVTGHIEGCPFGGA